MDVDVNTDGSANDKIKAPGGILRVCYNIHFTEFKILWIILELENV